MPEPDDPTDRPLVFATAFNTQYCLGLSLVAFTPHDTATPVGRRSRRRRPHHDLDGSVPGGCECPERH